MHQYGMESKVYQILKEDEQARDDDWYLIGKLFERQARIKGVETIYLMKHSQDYLLPSAESITRSRRRIQEKFKDLRGQNYKGRQKEEESYREYYGG